jgi:hypothetical protein
MSNVTREQALEALRLINPIRTADTFLSRRPAAQAVETLLAFIEAAPEKGGESETIAVKAETLQRWWSRFMGYTDDARDWNYSHIVEAADEMRLMLEGKGLPARYVAHPAAAKEPGVIVDETLNRFERCVSTLVSPEYADGYREACEHIRAALTAALAQQQQQQGTRKEG